MQLTIFVWPFSFITIIWKGQLLHTPNVSSKLPVKPRYLTRTLVDTNMHLVTSSSALGDVKYHVNKAEFDQRICNVCDVMYRI